jgi:hypothetical protein
MNHKFTTTRALLATLGIAFTFITPLAASTALADEPQAARASSDGALTFEDSSPAADGELADDLGQNSQIAAPDSSGAEFETRASNDFLSPDQNPINDDATFVQSYVDLPMFKVEKLIWDAVEQGKGINFSTFQGGSDQKLQIMTDELGRNYLLSYFANTGLLDSVEFQTPSGMNWSHVYWLQNQVSGIFEQGLLTGGVGIGINGEITVMTNQAGYEALASQLDPSDLQNLTFELGEDISVDSEVGSGLAKP